MSRLTTLFYVWILCLLSVSQVEAGEQRVLLSFDGSGHQIKQIVHISGAPAIRPGSETGNSSAVVPDLPALRSNMRTGFATLLWLDNEGLQMAVVYEPDPRLSHAPSHIDGSGESRLGENAGAWLVTGPEGATQLLVLLAEVQTLGLGFETWDLSLTGY